VALNFAACTSVESGPTTLVKHQTNRDGTADTKNNSIPSNSIDPPATNEVQIVIENFAFVPSELTIAPGTKVTWINKDEAPHTATSTEKKFNSGGLDTDDKFSFVFNDKGEFPYFCALHPHMTATITVK
jgi:plastocyanin